MKKISFNQSPINFRFNYKKNNGLGYKSMKNQKNSFFSNISFVQKESKKAKGRNKNYYNNHAKSRMNNEHIIANNKSLISSHLKEHFI